MLIDTHAHVSDAAFDDDREEALARAAEAGVGVVVEIAEEESQWPKAKELAETHPGRVFWTAGWHPYYASRAGLDLTSRFVTELAHPACVAVGEIGLDYHRLDSPPETQRRVLESLLAMAAQAGMPVVLHCREASLEMETAQQDLFAILLRQCPRPPDGGPPGVAHCFQGNAGMAWKLHEMGFMLGVDAPLTYPNATALRAIITHFPLESLVLETDSPYLPPQTLRGQRNEPARLPAVVRALAELKHVSVGKIEEVTTANARRLFRLPALVPNKT